MTYLSYLFVINCLQETQGVFVATFGKTKDFPAFYCQKSDSQSPYNVTSAKEAAGIIKSSKDIGLESGMLFAVPVPDEYALNDEEMNKVVEQALEDARKSGISGKHITPYLLARVTEATGGRSLTTSILIPYVNYLLFNFTFKCIILQLIEGKYHLTYLRKLGIVKLCLVCAVLTHSVRLIFVFVE